MAIRLALLLMVALAVPRPVPPPAQEESTTVIVVGQWLQAVVRHTPGTADAAVQSVWSLSPDSRKIIADEIPLIVNLLSVSPTEIKSAQDEFIAKLVDSLGTVRGTPRFFLERAAMLHADAAMFDRRPPPAPAPDPRAPASGRPVASSGMTSGAVVSNGRSSGPSPSVLILTRDGEVTGTVAPNWNWPFARGFLDRIVPLPADDSFVGLWYHAVAAYMFRNGQLGEVTPHLTHAAIALPNDPRVLFDEACLSETLSMDRFQQLITDDRGRRAFNAPTGGFGVGMAPPSAGSPSLPTADAGNARAEQLFRRALERDPSMAEARVRLARVLELQKHDEEAADQIQRALAGSPDRVVSFFAHLFGTRAANALGRLDEAEAHARAALELFPQAGSALLAGSQTALLRADIPTALERIAPLRDAPANPGDRVDPWWQYPYGVGRDAEQVLTALWRAVPAPPVTVPR